MLTYPVMFDEPRVSVHDSCVNIAPTGTPTAMVIGIVLLLLFKFWEWQSGIECNFVYLKSYKFLSQAKYSVQGYLCSTLSSLNITIVKINAFIGKHGVGRRTIGKG